MHRRTFLSDNRFVRRWPRVVAIGLMGAAVLLLNEPSAFAVPISLTTTATVSAPVGTPISDIAHLAAAPGASGEPTGSIFFSA
ncbi:MAG: hypothetical protein QOE57_2728, partial [Acidimicrobiaceae bacterium]|nr:hypothetical protein [Acidimicrobiaceae bacterium]